MSRSLHAWLAIALFVAMASVSGCGRGEPEPPPSPGVTEAPPPVVTATPGPVATASVPVVTAPPSIASTAPAEITTATTPPPPSPSVAMPEPEPQTPEERIAAYDAKLRKGILLTRLGRPAEAIPFLQKAMSYEPHDLTVIRALRQAEREANLAGANAIGREKARLERIADRDRGFGAFRAALRAGQTEIAGGILAGLRDRYPDDASVFEVRAELEEARRQRAVKVLAQRREEQWRGMLGAAAAARTAGKLEEARDQYRAALALYPNDPATAKLLRSVESLLGARASDEPSAPPGGQPTSRPSSRPVTPSPSASPKSPKKKKSNPR